MTLCPAGRSKTFPFQGRSCPKRPALRSARHGDSLGRHNPQQHSRGHDTRRNQATSGDSKATTGVSKGGSRPRFCQNSALVGMSFGCRQARRRPSSCTGPAGLACGLSLLPADVAHPSLPCQPGLFSISQEFVALAPETCLRPCRYNDPAGKVACALWLLSKNVHLIISTPSSPTSPGARPVAETDPLPARTTARRRCL